MAENVRAESIEECYFSDDFESFIDILEENEELEDEIQTLCTNVSFL